VCEEIALREILGKCLQYSKFELGFRIFYSAQVKGLKKAISSVFGSEGISIIPIASGQSSIMISGFGYAKSDRNYSFNDIY